MQKCTLCVHRVTKGLLPACVTTCIAKTRFFGEVNELSKVIRQKRAKTVSITVSDTGPSGIYTNR